MRPRAAARSATRRSSALGAPSVVARIQPDNAASAKVAAALGLTPERDTTNRHGVPVRIHRLMAGAVGARPARLASPRECRSSFPTAARKELDDGASGADLAAAIGPGLARAALAVKVDGQLRDLARPLADGERVEIVTDRSPESLELIRHDTAHVLAAAVLDLYPGTRISIGPPIEDGFYYDFEFPDGRHRLRARPARRSRRRCASTSSAQEEFTREDIDASTQALERFRAEDQPYKVELIEDLVRDAGVETVSLYTNGPFTDLCRGPHAPDDRAGSRRSSCSRSPARTGAATPTRQMLTRIYGTAFHSAKDLDAHLERLEQARARDHRKLGRELNLFMFSELSPGLAVLAARRDGRSERARASSGARENARARLPRGQDADPLRRRAVQARPATGTCTATTCTSPRSRTAPMGLKPMNCPAHIQLYKDARRSYRDLPIRYSEAGLVHRHEPSGTLHGLLRVRHITQDDAHIFCTEEQIPDEVDRCLDFGFALYDTFGFEPRLELSTRPDEADRHRGDVGPRRGGAGGRARAAAASSSSSTRATARSTGRRSTCT